MRERVRRMIERQRLAFAGEPLWVAVSGGLDSMVLLHLLRELGHDCHVAHVDHGLRGIESDADRAFVEAYCAERSIVFRSIKVDVASHAAAFGASLQSAARELRYTWFNELVSSGPAAMAMAHHRDDAIETLFLHLMRGMGLRGWGTIPVRSGPFIRPLLDEGREDIAAYAAHHRIPFREDASNTDPKYLRNRVRNELLPMLENWRPGTRRALGRNVELLRELDALAQRATGEVMMGLVAAEDGTLRIPFARVMESGAPKLVLYRALGDLQLHPDRFEDILTAISERSVGASFPAGDRVVFIDRDQLVIAPASEERRSWKIEAPELIPPDAPLMISHSIPEGIDLHQGAEVAWLDADTLLFPLELRPWRDGDRMRPIGLGGSKLVSDILIDAKVPRHQKDACYVLVAADTIVWLCGHRIAEGFQAKATSRSVLRCVWTGAPVPAR
ncbi:MAG: tRNA lysidine(34) synthetase TilS [Flavobacteriales bacterium]